MSGAGWSSTPLSNPYFSRASLPAVYLVHNAKLSFSGFAVIHALEFWEENRYGHAFNSSKYDFASTYDSAKLR